VGNILDDKNLDWSDEYRDFILSNKKNNPLYSINNKKIKFNWENLEGEFINEYDEFDFGLSRKSHKVTKVDEQFIDYEDKINKGHSDDDDDYYGLPHNIVAHYDFEDDYEFDFEED